MIPRKRIRPSTVIATIALVIVSIAINQLWLWVVVIAWMLLVLYTLLMYISGRVF